MVIFRSYVKLKEGSWLDMVNLWLILWIIFGESRDMVDIPSGNLYKNELERSSIFSGKTHYFNGIMWMYPLVSSNMAGWKLLYKYGGL